MSVLFFLWGCWAYPKQKIFKKIDNVRIISAEEVHEALKYPDFVNILKEAYAGSYTMPPRKVFLLEERARCFCLAAVMERKCDWREIFHLLSG
ncbi:MAG: hypothetical protein CM1200mP10_12170 [Candidatus Neomarinimicrobiota bacterium]|nr:MAG: hypothetical protein CM1200mP10_12170 [Candidatus Neomarinimicrobiota bacterium]